MSMFSVSSVFLKDHNLLRSRNFATMTTWRNFFLYGVSVVLINDVCMCASFFAA